MCSIEAHDWAARSRHLQLKPGVDVDFNIVSPPVDADRSGLRTYEARQRDWPGYGSKLAALALRRAHLAAHFDQELPG